MSAPKHQSSLWAGSLVVYAALMALLALTLVLAYAPLGGWNGVASYTIAGAKALLVALVFMRLARSQTVARLAALAGLVWLATLFSLTFTDYPFRQAGETIRVPVSSRNRDAATDLPQ